MPICDKCGESAPFHELSGFEVPATEACERLCFKCVQAELEQVKAINQEMVSSMLRLKHDLEFQLNATQQELERVKAQLDQANKREAITHSIPEMLDKARYVFEDSKDGMSCVEYLQAIYETDQQNKTRLSSPADHSPAMVPVEKVRPLVEALRWCWEECHITGNFGCVEKALQHAKELGL